MAASKTVQRVFMIYFKISFYFLFNYWKLFEITYYIIITYFNVFFLSVNNISPDLVECIFKSL